MILKTKRLILRPLAVSDLESAYAYLGDRENCPYMSFLPHDSAEETLSYLREAEAEWQKETPRHLHFAVLLDGAHIGEVFFYIAGSHGDCSDHCDHGGLGELGWLIRHDLRGRGYAFEAAEAVRDFALRELKLKTLVAHCDTRNTASERIMQKLGMTLHERGKRFNRAQPDIEADEVGYIFTNGAI
ncbi:MAG: GNAT family N-acetyltransferase [Oscillospiraceae bacterium]|nr:GNAT family N-acetyltransferase [Oscillospiraceae bacterium]